MPEHNMISLLRKNCCLGYDDANTMLVPKSQVNPPRICVAVQMACRPHTEGAVPVHRDRAQPGRSERQCGVKSRATG